MQTVKKTIGSLQEDLCQLQRRLDTLESRAKIAQLEAAEIYDKTLRLMQRMAKRYEVDKKDLVSPDTPLPLEVVDTSDGMDSVSRRILARRAGGAK